MSHVQGMLFAHGDALPVPSHIVRLYAHEATRVYRDKLVNFEDQKVFDQLLLESLRKNITVRETISYLLVSKKKGKKMFPSFLILFFILYTVYLRVCIFCDF